MPINLVLADAQPVFLSGLKQVLTADPDFAVVACCSSGAEALSSVRKLRPDVLVTELRLKGLDGLSLLAQLRTLTPPTRAVVLTDVLTAEDAIEIMRLGVAGVVLKDMAPELVKRCIRKVHDGGRWMETHSVASALEQVLRREAASQDAGKVLSKRELTVTRLVASGLRNKEIARALDIAEGTVKVHLHSVYDKLKVRGRAALVAYAQRRGLV